jgi:hypothetical protein
MHDVENNRQVSGKTSSAMVIFDPVSSAGHEQDGPSEGDYPITDGSHTPSPN